MAFHEMASAEALQRKTEFDKRRTHLHKEAERGNDPRLDPDWNDFTATYASHISIPIIAKYLEAAKRSKIKTLVAECLSHSSTDGTFALGHKTNRLLGAILLKLHGIEE